MLVFNTHKLSRTQIGQVDAKTICALPRSCSNFVQFPYKWVLISIALNLPVLKSIEYGRLLAFHVVAGNETRIDERGLYLPTHKRNEDFDYFIQLPTYQNSCLLARGQAELIPFFTFIYGSLLRVLSTLQTYLKKPKPLPVSLLLVAFHSSSNHRSVGLGWVETCINICPLHII